MPYSKEQNITPMIKIKLFKCGVSIMAAPGFEGTHTYNSVSINASKRQRMAQVSCIEFLDHDFNVPRTDY